VGTLRKWCRTVVVNLRQVAKSTPVSITVVRILRGMVCRLDCHLRRAFRIREFSLDRNCILRLAKVRWKRPVELQDVMQIAGGDWIGDLHLWNEHVPRILGSRTSLSTGARFRTTMMSSITSLAVYAAIEPGMREVVAFHARVSGADPSRRNWQSLAKRFGYTVLMSKPSFAGRVHDYFAFLLMRGLTWVFNPQRRLVCVTNAVRFDIWISRKELLRRFAPESVVRSQERVQKAGGTL
jgi:hypothetical protein